MDVDYISQQDYNKHVDTENFVIVYPKGQADYGGVYENDGWYSWNVGHLDPEVACTDDIHKGYCYSAFGK